MDADIYERTLAHDIREINKQLKTSAERVRMTFKRNRNIVGKDESNAHKVYFASELITKRLDVYDFYKNQGQINTTEERYKIHRVLTKLSKILEEKSEKKRLSVAIAESGVEIETSGKFEVALFVIFENFVKYSPDRGKLVIEVKQNDSGISICFSAYGPMATESERASVFEMGGRAKMAKKMTGEGSGIGLHFAKSVCDLHGFHISFDQIQSNAISQGGIDFHYTTVMVEIPANL